MVVGLTDADLLEVVQPFNHLAQRGSGVPLGVEADVTGLLVAVVHFQMVVVGQFAKYLLQFGILKGAYGAGLSNLLLMNIRHSHFLGWGFLALFCRRTRPKGKVIGRKGYA